MQDGSACKGSKLSAVTCTYESTHGKDVDEYEYKKEEERNKIEEERNEKEEEGRNERKEKERIKREGINVHSCRTNGMTKQTR